MLKQLTSISKNSTGMEVLLVKPDVVSRSQFALLTHVLMTAKQVVAKAWLTDSEVKTII